MADFSKITLNGIDYELSDDKARLHISKLKMALGDVKAVSTKAAMTDTSKVYFYTGSENGMTKGALYYAVGDEFVSGEVLDPNFAKYGFAGIHNSIYRGKFLGTALTAEQSAAIRAGTFDDLYIGDYWTIGGVNYRIADFDYFFNKGDTACTTHHIVVVPDSVLRTNVQMNPTNTTEGGYIGSDMFKTTLAVDRDTITSAFGGTGHILNHREYIQNAVTNGIPSAGAWYSVAIELMSEEMVYGSPQWKPMNRGTVDCNIHNVNYRQLSLFRLDPTKIVAMNGSDRKWYWLRDPASAAHFCDVADGGNCNRGGASTSDSGGGSRPFAVIY